MLTFIWLPFYFYENAIKYIFKIFKHLFFQLLYKKLLNEPSAFQESWRYGAMRCGSNPKFWNEVYKVIDSSHVLIEVIDARDPIGTRCHAIENYLKTEKPFKNLILVLNKCDLVPTSYVRKWLFILSRKHPVVAFRWFFLFLCMHFCTAIFTSIFMIFLNITKFFRKFFSICRDY